MSFQIAETNDASLNGLAALLRTTLREPSYSWNFDRILEQARKKFSSDEFQYANALALAFLDESKVSELEKYERWRKLEPVDPKIQPQGVAS
jgi:hypothetical protein